MKQLLPALLPGRRTRRPKSAAFRRIAPVVGIALLALTASCDARDVSTLRLADGDRVVFLGDTLMEREQHFGWIETMLTTRYPDRHVTFRNLGWSGDTPAGVARVGLSRVQATKSPPGEGWRQLTGQLDEVRPTVLFIGYGMAASFAGEAGLSEFIANYERLLDHIALKFPACRVYLLGPLPHQPNALELPRRDQRSRVLRAYDERIRQIAESRRLPFVSLIGAWPAEGPSDGLPSNNGIHLTEEGYWLLAQVMEQELFHQPGEWRRSPHIAPLRRAIIEKNALFFDHSRPANVAYLLGFRSHEQGRNAGELARFEALISEQEARIAQLRRLRPIPRAVSRGEIPSLFTAASAQSPPSLALAADVTATIWAESPLIAKPVQMNFDPQGRLWVVTSQIYPQIEPGEKRVDKVVVLQDTTGRGIANQASIFAEDLTIPTGVLPGDGGVYVAQGTELLHFADTDRDGKADARRIVLSGFGTEDTHHNLHTLHWGPDGRMYMIQSNNIRTHVETPWEVVRHEAGGVFAFTPAQQRLNVVYRGWVNAWGHRFDAFGQPFVTDGAGNAGVYWAIPGATYRTVAPADRVMESISPGAYPKFCGLEIVRSRLFPPDWQGDMVTCDFRAHRVVRFKVSDDGAGYVTKEMPDVARSTNSTFRPIDVKLGPDGALYVADWSNPIIQHGEVDFRDPRRDKRHGRIWRIAPKNRAVTPAVAPDTLVTAKLLDALTSDDATIASRARRVLLEDREPELAAELGPWADRQTEPAGLYAGITLYAAAGDVPPAFASKVLKARDPRVRAAALRWLGASFSFEQVRQVITDAHPRVRLEAVRALAQFRSGAAAQAALQVLDRPMDRFLEYALWVTLRELGRPWVEAIHAGAIELSEDAHLAFAIQAVEPELAGSLLAAVLARRTLAPRGEGPWIELVGRVGAEPELTALFEQLLRNEFDETASARVLDALANAARERGRLPDSRPELLGRFLARSSGPLRAAALRLAREWDPAAHLAELRKIAASPDTADEERSLAFEALLATKHQDLPETFRQLTASSNPDVRSEAVLALARIDLKGAAPQLVALLAETSGNNEELWRRVLAIAGADKAIAPALAESELPVFIARLGLRVARETSGDPALVDELTRLTGTGVARADLTRQEIARVAQSALKSGDPVRGELIYRRPELACTACHAIGGIGGKVGPELTSIGASAQADYLLESLIYPNARIKEGYLSLQVSTHDRRVISGTLARESLTELTLRTVADETITVPKTQVRERVDAGSLMPPGLVAQLTEDELRDLVSFLTVLGKNPRYDASQGGVARLWNLYLVTSANQAQGIERVVRGDPALPDWVPLHALVNGDVPRQQILEQLPALDQSTDNPRGLYAAVRFTAPAERQVSFTLEGDVAEAWLNGAPVEVQNRRDVRALRGENVLVFRLEENALPKMLRLSSPDVTFAIASFPQATL